MLPGFLFAERNGPSLSMPAGKKPKGYSIRFRASDHKIHDAGKGSHLYIGPGCERAGKSGKKQAKTGGKTDLTFWNKNRGDILEHPIEK